MFPGDFGEIAEQLRRSTVRVLVGNQGGGSGVIWSADGTIITNAHVARGAPARVELWDGRTFPVEVESRDVRRDLAKFKIKAGGLRGIEWRAASSLRAGELALAVGNPLGFVGALTTGVIHGSGSIRELGSLSWVQAAIRLAPGNSGGPLADAAGRVIGINTMVVSGGLALAIPGDAVASFLKNGSRAALGVVVQPVSARGGEAGLLVLEVLPGTPASNASLLQGDLLTGADDVPFRSAGDLADAIDRAGGRILRLQFRRGTPRIQREVSVLLPSVRQEAA